MPCMWCKLALLSGLLLRLALAGHQLLGLVRVDGLVAQLAELAALKLVAQLAALKLSNMHHARICCTHSRMTAQLGGPPSNARTSAMALPMPRLEPVQPAKAPVICIGDRVSRHAQAGQLSIGAPRSRSSPVTRTHRPERRPIA